MESFSKASDDYQIGKSPGSLQTGFRISIKQNRTISYGVFSEGLCSVKKNGKYGYIDTSGKEVIPPKYEWALPFKNSKAEITLNGRKLLINNKGEEIK